MYIRFAKIDFNCPHCTYQYSDDDDKYINRINNNQKGYTLTKCKGCKRKFGIAADYKGLLSFNLKE